jgi:actin-related protein
VSSEQSSSEELYQAEVESILISTGFSQLPTTGSNYPRPFETIERDRLITAVKCGANEINRIEAPQTRNG